MEMVLVMAVLVLAYSNGANDNFKGVATLFGSGLYCDPTGHCAAKIDLGQPCTAPVGSNNPCWAGSCNATTMVCAAVCM